MEEHTRSYRDAVQTGRSDGSVSGNRGQQEHYRRNAAVYHEANKLGETIWRGVLALFIHPVFCFAGFWVLGTVLMIFAGPMIGVTENASDDPGWYLWVAGGVPLVLAVLLRRHVRKIMIGVLIAAVVFLAVKMLFEVREIRAERAGTASAPAATAPAVAAPAATAPAASPPAAVTPPRRVLTPEEVQQALDDAYPDDVTSTPPEGSFGSEVDRVYCSGPVSQRPDFCN